MPLRFVDLALFYVGNQPFVLCRIDPDAVTGENILLFKVAVSRADFPRYRYKMAYLPVVDATVQAICGISSRAKAGDLASDHLMACIGLAIHHIHMAITCRVPGANSTKK